MSPLVSVCILTFNSSKFVAQTIESAIKQTLADIEIIIVDNCSTDTTVEICSRYKEQDARITIYKNDIPLGITGGLNSCLERSKGEYVKILMHDDMLEPESLERMIEVFKHNPSVKLVGCSERQIDEAGKVMPALAAYSDSGVILGRKVAREILHSMTNSIGTPSSVLMRRKDYGDGFKRDLFLFEDTEMYLRVLLTGNFYFIKEPLSIVRVHSATGSSINSNTLIFISDLLRLKEMYADFMQEEGLNKSDWSKLVDERILAYVGHMIESEGITEKSVREYSHRLQGLAGYDYTEQLIEAMAYIIFYGYSRLFKTNLEATYQEKENQRLREQIEAMSRSLPFKMVQPLRDLKAKLFSS